MIHSAKALDNHRLLATDGEIGRVKGLYFDAGWKARYFVVETGSWLDSRRVLISTAAINLPDWDRRQIPVLLTQEQVRNSPAVDTTRPVSRHDEAVLNAHYGWAPYWGQPGLVDASFGLPPTPAGALGLGFGTVGGPDVPPAEPVAPRAGEENAPRDGVVHSTHEATGYHIEATDGAIGHADDFLFEDDSWTIQFIVVDTRNWLPGKKVLVAPTWIQAVVWGESRILVDLSRDAIRSAPDYDPSGPFTAEDAVRLHDHYKPLPKD